MSHENKSLVRIFFDLLELNLALPEELLAPDITYHVLGYYQSGLSVTSFAR